MAYQAIARKWRPQTFEDVTGQEIITQTLRNALEHDRLHPAYLFSGARGVGKTTTARILAKSLNCHKTTRPNLFPCSPNDSDACPSCLEVAESRSLDVLEFDAASNTQVDKIRDLILEGINIAPARDRYKVFIIDEVHMLSTSSFNALLKTLEEPPRNVVFIMATTELHKVPVTILSRCQEFEFRTIPLQTIFDRLRLIADAEKIDVSDAALRELARSGEGSMRDAQSNFDQVISFSGDQITVDDVTAALGFAGLDILTRVAEAIAGRDSKGILDAVSDLVSRGHDLRNFCRDLLGLFRDILVSIVAGNEEGAYGSLMSHEDLQKLSHGFSESDLIRFFHSLAETETALKEATQSRYVLEVGLMRLIEFHRIAAIEDVLERLIKLEAGLGIAAPRGGDTDLIASKVMTAEKKTLDIEKRTVDDHNVHLPDGPTNQTSPTEPTDAADVMPESIPPRLLPLTEEDLAHAADTWLDIDYERKLLQSGDDLSPLSDAKGLAELIIGPQTPNTTVATVAAPARNIAEIMPTFDEFETPANDVELPESPTPEQLEDFAASQPLVRKALRIFRARIVDVRQV
ncbi:MAG: DNA polymerase III subunit gamma/tau [Pyrinomonadaceae bacterium]